MAAPAVAVEGLVDEEVGLMIFFISNGMQIANLMCAQAGGVLPSHMDPQQLS